MFITSIWKNIHWITLFYQKLIGTIYTIFIAWQSCDSGYFLSDRGWTGRGAIMTAMNNYIIEYEFYNVADHLKHSSYNNISASSTYITGKLTRTTISSIRTAKHWEWNTLYQNAIAKIRQFRELFAEWAGKQLLQIIVQNWPPCWSSGQRAYWSWGREFDPRHFHKYWMWIRSGTASTQPREDNWVATWLRSSVSD